MYDETIIYFLTIISIMVVGWIIIYKLLTYNACYHANDCIKNWHKINYKKINDIVHFCTCLTCENNWWEFHNTYYHGENNNIVCKYCSFGKD